MINELVEFYKNNYGDFEHDLEWSFSPYVRYPMGRIDVHLDKKSPSDILRMAFRGRDDGGAHTFCPERNYFYFDAIGNLVSTDDDSGYSEYLNANTVGHIIDSGVPYALLSEGAKAIIDKWKNK